MNSKRVVYQATVPFFQPMDEIYLKEEWKDFQKHYDDINGKKTSKQEIINNVYGGFPLKNLFSHFQIESNENDLRERRATIRLIPATSVIKPLIIYRLSLKQFLVAGLPSRDLLPWDGKDNWSVLDSQYRLELCHAEVCRWSIFIKSNGVLLSDAQVENHEQFSDIELINNCTTTDGFEFKLVSQGITYHGSFGSRQDENTQGIENLSYLYRRLSQWQAGSLGYQKKDLMDERNNINFFSYYFNPIPIKDDRLNPKFEFVIDLKRYRANDISEETYPVSINLKEIDYKRWGNSSEYFQKPIRRRLMAEIAYDDDHNPLEPPSTYEQIATAKYVKFPNFDTNGIYDLSKLETKKYYSWLYDFKTCKVRYLIDGRVELELSRIVESNKYELRRFVFGNIRLDSIPIYPDFWTLHRFGYGARDTVMNYDANFLPPSETPQTSHYAYQLGGEDEEPEKAFNYICPEGFGVERAIFSWEDYSKTKLVIDLISFERILPVWQGVVDFSNSL